MTNKLVVIINSLKVPKIKKILLYEIKFLVPNYSCLQNPWLGGYSPQIPVLSVLNWICWTHPNNIPGNATDSVEMFSAYTQEVKAFYPEDDPLCLQHAVEINATSNVVVLKTLHSLCCINISCFSPQLLLAGVAYKQHQPATAPMDITRSCSYSDMLLMMGENIVRNI